MSTYVITGGAGFIGAALAAHLGRAGHDVRVLDNLSAAESRRRAAALCDLPRVTLIEGDVREAQTCRRVCAGAEYVLHHAAVASEDPALCAEVNTGGTVQMLEAARAAGTVQRFICASSGAVYGDTPAMCKHEAGQTDPLSPQASSLLSAEHFCRSAFRQHGLQTVCLRYFHVYGPGQSAAGDDAPVIARFLRALARRESPVLEGSGEQSRDFVYIDDVVEANRRAVAAVRGVGGKVFNVGSGQRLSLNQLLERLEHLTGRRIEAQRAAPRPGDIKHLRADISAAAGLLQWTPAVGIEDGLARTLQWVVANAG
ncbi:MAG: NAD-dependent epimerase/dehydratase family protein [Armatimonadetes bacterium]|nr:NAD-dependent epimerase/dehydratase family protein [Armatimonadota bacterium]